MFVTVHLLYGGRQSYSADIVWSVDYQLFILWE